MKDGKQASTSASDAIGGRLRITDELCLRLGVSREAIASMDLETFAGLVFDKGFDVEMMARESGSATGRLKMDFGCLETSGSA